MRSGCDGVLLMTMHWCLRGTKRLPAGVRRGGRGGVVVVVVVVSLWIEAVFGPSCRIPCTTERILNSS